MSNAIDGTNHATSRPFAIAYTTASTAETGIVRGSYLMCASTDCVAKFGATGLTAAAALGSTQPAAAATFSVQFFAGQERAVDLEGDLFVRVIGNTASGTLTIQGPIGRSANP